MELKKELAEAVVNDFIYDDDTVFECLSCGGLGDYKENINHTSSCIVPRAKFYLQEVIGD